MIPELFEPLMAPHLEKVDERLSPGLTVLYWSSISISEFLQEARTALEELELLVTRAKNLLEVRILGQLDSINSTVLCELPEGSPWTMEELLKATKVMPILIIYTQKYYACM